MSEAHVPHTPDRIQALIDAAQDEQAMDAANRGQVTAELDAGGPMRAINEKHHAFSTGSHAWVANIVAPFLIGLFIFLFLWGTGFLGGMHGGWPA